MITYRITNIDCGEHVGEAWMYTQLEIVREDGSTHTVSEEEWIARETEAGARDYTAEQWSWENIRGGKMEEDDTETRLVKGSEEVELGQLLADLWKAGKGGSKKFELPRGMKQWRDYMEADVYRNATGDCTNGGASSKHDSIAICTNHVDKRDILEFCEMNNDDPARFFALDICHYAGIYFRLKPVIYRGHSMAGGNWAWACDSRWKEFTGSQYPLSIHDRYEH